MLSTVQTTAAVTDVVTFSLSLSPLLLLSSSSASLFLFAPFVHFICFTFLAYLQGLYQSE